MENAIKNSSKLNFCKTAARAAFRALNGLPLCAALSVCAACGSRAASQRLSVFPGSSYDVIISIGGHAVNNGVENRKRGKAY